LSERASRTEDGKLAVEITERSETERETETETKEESERVRGAFRGCGVG